MTKGLLVVVGGAEVKTNINQARVPASPLVIVTLYDLVIICCRFGLDGGIKVGLTAAGYMETGSNISNPTSAVAAPADGGSQRSLAQIHASCAQNGGSSRRRMPACPLEQWCSRTSWQTCTITCQVCSSYRDANVFHTGAARAASAKSWQSCCWCLSACGSMGDVATGCRVEGGHRCAGHKQYLALPHRYAVIRFECLSAPITAPPWLQLKHGSGCCYRNIAALHLAHRLSRWAATQMRLLTAARAQRGSTRQPERRCSSRHGWRTPPTSSNTCRYQPCCMRSVRGRIAHETPAFQQADMPCT